MTVQHTHTCWHNNVYRSRDVTVAFVHEHATACIHRALNSFVSTDAMRLQYVHNIGMLLIKNYTYLRDTIWNNLRRSVSKRWDERKNTGAEGGEVPEYDDIVMDIIGMKKNYLSAS